MTHECGDAGASPPATKAKPLKKPKSDKKDYDEVDMANIQKKKRRGEGTKGVESQGTAEGKLRGFWAQEKWKEVRALYLD